MDVDGRDLIRCAHAHGREPVTAPPDEAGPRDLDLDFDPRCDFDDDAVVSDADLDLVVQHFTEGVTAHPGAGGTP
jgi:hypothetical protein